MRRRVLPFLVVVAACYDVPIAPATPSVWRMTGDGQTGVPGYRLPNLIVARVSDADGRPIVGDTIDFTPSDPLALVEPRSVSITDSTGSAAVAWRLGPTLGSQTLSAHSRVPGVSAVTITATSKSNSVQSIDGGSTALCAVDLQGRLACWIPPRRGTADATPRFMPVTASAHFAQVAIVAVSGTNAPTQGCALADTGQPWCFTLDSQADVIGLTPLGGTNPPLTQLVGGGSYGGGSFCGLSALGEAWCWGANDWGQLGDGTLTPRATPTAVATSARFAQLDIGGITTCGITNAGEAWCWGDNAQLQAGSATGSRNVTTPVTVNTALRFIKVRSLFWTATSCGFVASGGMACWGDVSTELLSCTPGCAPPTAVPVAVALSPQPNDIVEENLVTVVFDQRAGMQWTGGLPEGAGFFGSPFFTRSALPPGLLRDVRLAHGSGFVCGTASLGGATLCPSEVGLVGVAALRAMPIPPPVVGVPLP